MFNDTKDRESEREPMLVIRNRLRKFLSQAFGKFTAPLRKFTEKISTTKDDEKIRTFSVRGNYFPLLLPKGILIVRSTSLPKGGEGERKNEIPSSSVRFYRC